MSRKLQFLEDSILLRTARLSNMCESLQLITHLMRIAVLLEHTQFARLQFNTSTIIAKATKNGYLMVYHCVETHIKFTINYDKKICYQWVPIEYKTNLQEWNNGFLHPESKVIHHDSATMNCYNPPTTFFTINDHVYSYKPGHIPARMDSDKQLRLPILVTNTHTSDANTPAILSTLVF